MPWQTGIHSDHSEVNFTPVTDLEGKNHQFVILNLTDHRIFKLTDFSGRKNTIYYFMRYDVAYNGKVRQIVDGRKRVVVSYRYDKLSGNVTRIRDMAKNDINFQNISICCLRYCPGASPVWRRKKWEK